MAGKSWYEVRIRECLQPGRFTNGNWVEGRWVKKSKFYFARNPQEAAGKYKGKGHLMWVEKYGKEKLLGVGEFFRLGDSLLKELGQGGGLTGQVEKDKEKRRQKRSYDRNLRRR